MSERPIQVEVCIESVDDARVAEAVGAHRIELCSALALGGLTPTPVMIRAVRQAVDLPIMAMTRPRPGGFCYSNSEFDIIRREIDAAFDAGADGIVCGVLNESGQIDFGRCKKLIEQIGDRPVVFHRAFDFTPRPLEALEALIELKFARLLTSGQRATAIEGAELIRDLRQRAAGRIEILPGSGINAGNVRSLLDRSGCDQVHLSARAMTIDPILLTRPNVPLATIDPNRPNYHAATSEQRLRELIAELSH